MTARDERARGPLDDLLDSAAGFPSCIRCMYVETGSAALCLRCASRSLQPLAPLAERCSICDQPYQSGATECRNPICNASWRAFEWNYAIAMRTPSLKGVIANYKYHGRRRWAVIFGRILAGFLDQHRDTFEAFAAITASPTYTGPGGRAFDHTREVLVRADIESGGRWPFDLGDPPMIIKTAETTKMATLKTYQERKAMAQTELRAALSVPDPAATRGKTILVYDDLFTDGLVLNEVARALREEGHADEVCGVTLARQPWGRD